MGSPSLRQRSTAYFLSACGSDRVRSQPSTPSEPSESGSVSGRPSSMCGRPAPFSDGVSDGGLYGPRGYRYDGGPLGALAVMVRQYIARPSDARHRVDHLVVYRRAEGT